MNPDIIPYTDEEGKRLGAVLAKFGIPSFGPATGMGLLSIIKSIDELLSNSIRLDDDMKTLLTGYRNRLNDICLVAAGQQKEVIDTLSKMVTRQKK